MQRTLLLGLALVLVSCGDSEEADAGAADAGSAAIDGGANADDAGAADAGSLATDSGASADDAGTTDAGALVDAGGAPDAGVDASCARSIDDRIAGACDGRGMMICRMWARDNGGTSAIAQCSSPSGRCARADSCSEAGCTCGGEPECGDDQMCVSAFAGFSCVCLE